MFSGGLRNRDPPSILTSLKDIALHLGGCFNAGFRNTFSTLNGVRFNRPSELCFLPLAVFLVKFWLPPSTG